MSAADGDRVRQVAGTPSRELPWPGTRFPGIRFVGSRLMAARIMIAAFLLLSTGVYTSLAIQAASSGETRWGQFWLGPLIAATGPMAGAISRNLQSCCLAFSLQLLPYCAAFLIGGVVVQWLPLPRGTLSASVKLAAWVIGLLGWFAGIPLSFLHAFG